jgi:hypothetical protein
LRKLDDAGLSDTEPVKLKPTWRNKRVGDDRTAKRLDRFLVSEPLIEDAIRIRQWVSSSGESDHFLVLLEFASVGNKPSSLFKFNPGWLVEDDFTGWLKSSGPVMMDL